MEKIKDVFHDFSDVFFAITVAGVMFIVLALNLGGWFNSSANTVLADGSPRITQDQSSNHESEDNNMNMEVEDEQLEDVNVNTDSTKPTGTEEPLDNNDIDSSETEIGQENQVVQEMKTIVIPNGTFGTGVALILKDNGLINETDTFVQVAENLNLSGRLKSGSFEISTDATIEDMVKIISGQKK